MRVAWALLPEGLRERVELRFDASGALSHVEPAGPGPCIQALAIPGLCNAHTHLELSGLEQPGGQGLPAWVGGTLAQRASRSTAQTVAAIEAALTTLHQRGTASVGEVTNSRISDTPLSTSPMQGVVFHEVLGIHPGGVDESLAAVHGPSPSGFTLRAIPHAPYSCAPELLVAAVKSPALCGGGWPTMHLDEDPAERQFLMTGDGPWADVLDHLGRDRSQFVPPECTPVQYLERLGILDRVAPVHCTLTEGEDLRRLAQAGSPTVLCPRSNLHISGRLPAVEDMLAAGVRLALGTDSLASAPSLDVLDEVRLLWERFPQVPLATWLLAATQGSGEVLGTPARLEVGSAHPVLLLMGSGPHAWLDPHGERRWVETPKETP